MLDGCVNGNFMVGDSINVYLADAMQPIKFVTADSLDSEFDQVLIRVGTDLAGYNRPVGGNNGDGEQKRVEYESKQIGATGKTLKELREGFEQMIAEKKAEAEAKKREDGTPPIEAPIVGACTREDDMILPTYWKGFTSVGDEWCEDLDECDEIEFPDIELEVHENNWQNLNVCQDPTFLAGTAFFPSDSSQFREDFDIELCKQEGTDKVQFIFDDDIVINYVSDMCEANISAGQDILINDVYSFPNGTSCGDKIFWLELHKIYSMPTANIFRGPGEIIQSAYVIRYIWERHEEVHGDHFLEVAEGFKAEYLIKIKETIKQCSDFSSEEAAKSFFKKKAEEIIKDFYDATYNKDLRISTGNGNEEKMLEFERNTIHKRVIDDYLQSLINSWNTFGCD